MTLSDLIVQLQELEKDHGDHVVLMSMDPEGNGFHGLPESFLSVGFAVGDGHYFEYHEEEEGEELHPDAKPCICIWP